MQNERVHESGQSRLAIPLVNNPSLLAGVRVLLVDDDEFVRDLLTFMLNQEGVQVTTATSVKEALHSLSTLAPGELPHVIISDISMPDEDGYAFIRQLRALPPEQGGQIRAAALTAFGRPEDRVRVLMAGFQTHITKPVEQEELIAVVAALADRFGHL